MARHATTNKVNDRSSEDALLARLIKLTSRKEDFVTECFAAVLQADQRAAAQYWGILAKATRLRERRIRRVRTQCSMNNGSARCDLVLDAGGAHLAVEHKLESPQGHNQLLRYLGLSRREVTHVALVAADYQSVSTRVLKNPRYVRPFTGQDHFVWADFYPVLEQSEARGVYVAAATRALFDRRGLQPPHALIGHLHTRNPTLRAKLDGHLYKAWQPLLRVLRHKWEYADSSIVKLRQSEIYVDDGPSDLLRGVWLDPFSNPGSLRVRLKSDRRTKRDRMFERIESEQGRATIPYGRSLSIGQEPRTFYRQRYPWSVEVRIPWRVLLRHSTRTTMPKALKKFVLALMRTADSKSV